LILSISDEGFPRKLLKGGMLTKINKGEKQLRITALTVVMSDIYNVQ
jgi:hypothetical protein